MIERQHLQLRAHVVFIHRGDGEALCCQTRREEKMNCAATPSFFLKKKKILRGRVPPCFQFHVYDVQFAGFLLDMAMWYRGTDGPKKLHKYLDRRSRFISEEDRKPVTLK